MICELRQYPSFDKTGIYAGMNSDLIENSGPGYKARMQNAGVSQADAQQALGWSQTKVSRFVNGERKRVGIEERITFERWLEAVERKAGVSSPDAARASRVLDFPVAPAGRRIPLYGSAAGGTGGKLSLSEDCVVDMVERIPAQGTRDDVFAIEVATSAMEPRYFPAERVYCVRNRQPGPGRDVVVELKAGGAQLMQYAGMRDGFVFGRLFNPSEECRFALRDVEALHAVVGRG